MIEAFLQPFKITKKNFIKIGINFIFTSTERLQYLLH